MCPCKCFNIALMSSALTFANFKAVEHQMFQCNFLLKRLPTVFQKRRFLCRTRQNVHESHEINKGLK